MQWSSPAYAVCTSVGSSAGVCVVTDPNEGPGTAANPTLRYAFEEAQNSTDTENQYTIVIKTGTVGRISGASFVWNNVVFDGGGSAVINAPFQATTPYVLAPASNIALTFGTASGTGSTFISNVISAFKPIFRWPTRQLIPAL